MTLLCRLITEMIRMITEMKTLSQFPLRHNDRAVGMKLMVLKDITDP
jgi:hypothetical protein